MLATIIALTLSNSAPVTAETLAGPIKMKPSQIREYNRNLPRDHPNYIRCTTSEETGSLVKKQSTCRTNQEWSRLLAQSNDEARAMTESMQKGWTREFEPEGTINTPPNP